MMESNSAATAASFLLDGIEKSLKTVDDPCGDQKINELTRNERIGDHSDSESQHQATDASHDSEHQSKQTVGNPQSFVGITQQGGGAIRYPLLYVAPTGTISVMLRDDVIVEVSVDKALRVLVPGKFSAASNSRGTSSCVMHPQARIYQEDTRVYCQMGDDKLAVFGSQGVLFTMKRLAQAYLVSSSTVRGTTSIPLNCLQFPNLQSDFSLTLFYLQSQVGDQALPQCEQIVRGAHYEQREDGLLTININGVYIRQDIRGQVDVNCRPRFIRLSPRLNTISVRTHFVDMGVQEDDKAYVKRGVKRMHVSRSGMVVSDGNCITSMDHYGRIVSST